MAQRISRGKAKIRTSEEPFSLPAADVRGERLRSVLHVLYLLFSEGYASNSGPDLARFDFSGEAIRLARLVREALPGDPEVSGLLTLMLLTDARRPARTTADGELVALAEQDRRLWNRSLISEGWPSSPRRCGRGERANTSCGRPSPPSTINRRSTPRPRTSPVPLRAHPSPRTVGRQRGRRYRIPGRHHRNEESPGTELPRHPSHPPGGRLRTGPCWCSRRNRKGHGPNGRG